MKGYINGISFQNLEAERYWVFPKSYKGDKAAETKTMIFSNNFLASVKYDGFYERLIKDEDGNIILQGRSKSVSGEYLDKHEWVPQLNEFFKALPNGTCLLGELYLPSKRGSRNVTTILGCLKDKAIERQKSGEPLHYYVFDVWAYNGKSYLKTPLQERIKTLNAISDSLKVKSVPCPEVEFAKYYENREEIWEKLGEALANGEEGMVIYKKNGIPEPGKRTARKTLKIKKEIEQTIDAFVDGNYKPAKRLSDTKFPETWGFWENEKTGEKVSKNMFLEAAKTGTWVPITKAHYYGWASAISFSVMRDGAPYRIAWISGIPDSIKEEIVTEPEKWIHKVAELSAMELEEGTHCLRHGRIVSWRPQGDKNYQDCTFDQIA